NTLERQNELLVPDPGRQVTKARGDCKRSFFRKTSNGSIFSLLERPASPHACRTDGPKMPSGDAETGFWSQGPRVERPGRMKGPRSGKKKNPRPLGTGVCEPRTFPQSGKRVLAAATAGDQTTQAEQREAGRARDRVQRNVDVPEG